MNTAKLAEIRIGVNVVKNQIVLSGDYELDVRPGSTIVWESDYDISVRIEGDHPFILDPRSTSKEVRWFIPGDAPFYVLHKYTIAVFRRGDTITSDPIIVIVPPEGRRAK
jgi:hypothetical protein